MFITKSERAKIVACLKRGRSVKEVARQFHRAMSTIKRVRDSEPSINRPMAGVQTKMGYCPTPEQIRVSCLEIQAGWSDREFYDRASGCNSGTKLELVRYNMDRCGTTGRAFFSAQG